MRTSEWIGRVALCFGVWAGGVCQGGVTQWGQPVDPVRNVRLAATAGQVQDLSFFVEETRRLVYDVTDRSFKNEAADSFNLSDFDIDDSHTAFGFSFERLGRYFSLQLDATLMQPKANTVARRNYYIGVGEDVEFQGGRYDQMKIPEGTPIAFESTGGLIELRGLYSPFSFTPSPAFTLTPLVDFGLLAFAGTYKLDAGPPTGVVQYQFPPEDFVVGGRSKGFMGMGIPELGVGARMRMGAPDRVNLVVQGKISVFQYEGSSKYFTTAEHRDKNLDIDHDNIRLRATVEFPLRNGRAFFVGVQHTQVESHAEITVQDRPIEETIARQERFDKVVDFKISATTVLAGFAF